MPYYSFQIEARAPADVVAQRLAAVMGRPQSARERWSSSLGGMDAPSEPFIGSVEGTRFRASRRIGYRNSFLPVILGRIEPRGPLSTVHIRMRLHPFVLVFLLVWLSIASSGVFAAYAQQHTVPLGVALFPVFGIAITVAGFTPEAIKAKRMLAAAINGAAPNNSSKPTPLRGAA